MPLVAPVPALDDEERERYSRTVMVPEIGDEGQRRLRAARVLVIGAGGLGGPTLLGLACAGVGVLGVVDADRVDLGNLQRQFLHRVRDIGRRKTRSAARAVRALNPGVEVREHAVRLTPENAPDLFADYDVVVDGSDNFATRYLVADASAARGIPCVWGSVLRFEGQVAVFWPPHGPGYRDLYPDAPAEAPTCASAGVFGPLCALVGAQLTAEVVKLVTGVGRTLLGRVAVIDALGAEWRSIAIAGPGPEATDATPRHDAQRRGAPAANCTAARSTAPSLVTAVALRAELAAAGATVTLVDVREPDEPGGIPGAVRAPLSRLQTDPADVPVGPVVLYCARGVRSETAAGILAHAGRTGVRTLAGGLAAWDAAASG